jgi:hypothetical protein
MIPPIVHPSTLVDLASSPRFFLLCRTEQTLVFVDARDESFLGLGVAVNAIDHLSSDVGLIWLDHDPTLSRSPRASEGLGCPDFNPIENAFAKVKALLRKAAERSVDGLWSAIGRIIDCFTQTECKNFFTAAGYAAT